MNALPGRILPALLLALVSSCAAPRGSAPAPEPTTAPSASADPGKPLAFVNGTPVRWDRLRRPLIELAGGQALGEIVLDRRLEAKLKERGLTVTAADRKAERKRLLERMGGERADASRLLRGIRDRRGLGDKRFQALLWRNAALRKLVKDQVKVTEAALRQAFAIRYGKRYLARLITVPTLAKAEQLQRRIEEGADFAVVAAERSSDASARRGGLIAPISPADPSYPAAVREKITELEPGAVSDPVALRQGYALLKLEKVLEGQDVKFKEKRKAVARAVRARRERRAMARLARKLVDGADVVVLQDALERAWQRYRAQQEGSP